MFTENRQNHLQRHPALSLGHRNSSHINRPAQLFVSQLRLQHINCIIQQTETEGGLYIGDTISTIKAQILTNNKIQAILCCNSESAQHLLKLTLPIHMSLLDIRDRADFPIHLYFSSSYDFIQKNRKQKKNVLVQCHGGVSRSAAIVCSYLISKNSWKPEQALDFIRKKRERVRPNVGFWDQLQNFYRKQVMNRYCHGEQKPFWNTDQNFYHNFSTVSLLRPQRQGLVEKQTQRNNNYQSCSPSHNATIISKENISQPCISENKQNSHYHPNILGLGFKNNPNNLSKHRVGIQRFSSPLRQLI